TPELLSYRTAATRRRRRFKVRRREYVDAGTSFLEVKTRTGRGDTEKVREERSRSGGKLPRPGDGPLSGEDAVYVAERLQEAGVAPPEDRLFPTFETAYRRTTLLVGSEGSRTTIDESLVWRGTDLTSYSLEDLVVLETKSAVAPGAVDRWLWRSHRRPQRISKFATGMALLDPRLPANRWHRTIGYLRPHVRSLASAACAGRKPTCHDGSSARAGLAARPLLAVAQQLLADRGIGAGPLRSEVGGGLVLPLLLPAQGDGGAHVPGADVEGRHQVQ